MARATSIHVSSRQRTILEGWVRNRADSSYRLIERSRIILLASEGMSIVREAQRLDIDRQRVRRWRKRWLSFEEKMAVAERAGATNKDLSDLLAGVLNDGYRSGAPPTFTAEQLTQIIAVACEPPVDSGRPVTHWTPRELADEVMKRGIVESISIRHVDRVLKGGISVHTRASTG